MSDSWIKKMFLGYHSGGFVKGPSRPLWPDEVPIVASPPSITPLSPTGRVSEPPEPITVLVKSQQIGKSSDLARRAGLMEVDYAEIEKRVMAQMAKNVAVPAPMLGLRPSPYYEEVERYRKVFDLALLHALNKHIAYMLAYAGIEGVTTRIDEEGCGAFFAAAKQWEADDADTDRSE